VHLTEKSIQKIRPGAKREQYVDDETTGFGIRVEPSGRKSFYWFQKVRGTPRFRSLGEFPSMALSQARAAAVVLAGQAATWKNSGYSGPDPFDKKPAPGPATVPTFSELVEAYIDNHVRATANNPDKAAADLRWMVKKHLSTWNDRPICGNDPGAITTEDVLAVRNKISKTKYMSNRVVQTVKLLYTWAAGKSDGKINFWPVANPAADVSLHPEKKRERFLQPDELVRFRDELEKPEIHPDLKDFIILALCTGARKMNIWSMRWQDVSFELKTWKIPMSKSGAGYDVALTAAAINVLERRREEVSGEWVFPADNKAGHVRGGMEGQWSRFRKRAGLPDIRIHDLRRTCGSYQAISGISLQQIGANLGHKSLSSTAIYARLHAAALAEAREAGEAKMHEMEEAARRRMTTSKPKLLKSA
jgi:integrase